jgi:high-affinity iron transporter
MTAIPTDILVARGRKASMARKLAPGALAFGAAAVLALIVWQALTANGVPDPLARAASRPSATLDIAVLVFREGLECILVLSAITAGMARSQARYRTPVGWGVLGALAASLATWFIAARAIDALTDSVPALDVQAATGLLAIVVLLVVMNWFFHRIYWTGWISMHNRRKRALLDEEPASGSERSTRRVLFGLAALGFTSFYREGFEVVLFLQSYRLKLGGAVVLGGVLIGAACAGVVALLTFAARRKLPYKQMLVVTGVMLGAVLLVMVGEQVQEMQLAHWLSTTTIPRLERVIPEWAGMWFGVFPNVESLVAQAIAGVLVLGSFFAARPASR